MSFSVQWEDCSWFSKCDPTRLVHDVKGFRTLEVTAGRPALPPAHPDRTPLHEFPPVKDVLAPQRHHEWHAQSASWRCVGDCFAMERTRDYCAALNQSNGHHPMRAQLHAFGYVVLRGAVPPSAVDAMAGTVDQYIARRGKLLLVDHQLAKPGMLLLGIARDPALTQVFEWIHGNPKLHAALSHVFSEPAPMRQAPIRMRNNLPMRRRVRRQAWRFMSRAEVVVDRKRGWHTDGVSFEGSFAPSSTNQQLLNIGLYLQDHHNESGGALVIQPGNYPGNHPASGQPCVPLDPAERVRTLHPRKGDALLFSWAVVHKSDYVGGRREREPKHPVPHRSMVNLGYGPDTRDVALAAAAVELRDALLYGTHPTPHPNRP